MSTLSHVCRQIAGLPEPFEQVLADALALHGVSEALPPLAVQHRWALNHVRHNLSDYDELLERLSDVAHKGRPRKIAYSQVKRTVLKAIMTRYPQLRDGALIKNAMCV